MNTIDEEQIVKKAKNLLDSSANKVSLNVQMRLQAARTKALQAAQIQTENKLSTGNMEFTIPGWIGPISTSTIMASVLLVFALIWVTPVVTYTQQTDVFEDIEILSAEEDLELYQDLDFYIWLSNEKATEPAS